MNTREAERRAPLLAEVDRLAPPELALLQLLAVVGEPLPLGRIEEIWIKSGLDRSSSSGLPAPMRPALRRLKRLELVEADNQLNPLIQETMARRFFAASPSPMSTRHKGKPSTAKAEKAIHDLLEAIRAVLPPPSKGSAFYGRHEKQACPRVLRELRIALLSGDDQELAH